MNVNEFTNKYSKAVDEVCLNCTAPTGECSEVCNNCPVRKSMDYYESLFNPQFAD